MAQDIKALEKILDEAKAGYEAALREDPDGRQGVVKWRNAYEKAANDLDLAR